MRFLSLCSGIEAASVAWAPLGWKAAAVAEIEAFPSAVLAHHYPDVPNLGDITKFKEWPDLGTIDLICGGTPCQSFSIAGLRKGLADPRGNLSLTFLAIVDRYRPRYVIWENVPGVLSDDGGRSFASIVGGLGQLGYGWAYRVLDAQYVRVDGLGRAVPQRRRRVVVVGYLGDWRRAAAVLSEPESVLGNSPPRREAGQGTSASTAPSLVSSGRGVQRAGETRGQDPVVAVAPTLRAGGNQTGGDRPYGTDVDTCDSLIATRPVAATLTRGAESSGKGGYAGRRQEDDDNLVAHSLRAEGFDASEDGTGRQTLVPIQRTIAVNETVGAMCAESGPNTHGSRGVSGSQTLLSGYIQPVAYSIMPQNSGKDYKAREVDVAQPLMAGGPVGGNQGGDYLLQPVAFDTTQVTSKANRSNPKAGDPCHPLAAGAHPPAVAFAIQERAVSENPDNGPDGIGIRQDGAAYTVEARSVPQAVATGWAVRRLMPVECERLMGFPEIRKLVRIEVCHSSDHRPTAALAGTQNPRSPSSALNADASEYRPGAKRAAAPSPTSHLDHDLPVVLHVLINLERSAVQISRAGKLIWSANGAGEPGASPLPMPAADFVRLAAAMTKIAVPEIRHGEAASQPSATNSSHQWNGSASVSVSGLEIDALASDADLFTKAVSACMKSTTSLDGHPSLKSEQSLQTLSCCVTAAISSFIPRETRQTSSFVVILETIAAYTDITYRGKPAADGPRYKSLGNSWAVNVFRWVGRRIEMVEQIAADLEKERAA